MVLQLFIQQRIIGLAGKGMIYIDYIGIPRFFVCVRIITTCIVCHCRLLSRHFFQQSMPIRSDIRRPHMLHTKTLTLVLRKVIDGKRWESWYTGCAREHVVKNQRILIHPFTFGSDIGICIPLVYICVYIVLSIIGGWTMLPSLEWQIVSMENNTSVALLDDPHDQGPIISIKQFPVDLQKLWVIGSTPLPSFSKIIQTPKFGSLVSSPPTINPSRNPKSKTLITQFRKAKQSKHIFPANQLVLFCHEIQMIDQILRFLVHVLTRKFVSNPSDYILDTYQLMCQSI